MTNKPLRIAVLGTGRIGAMHAQLLHHQIDEATLVAVYDTVDESARRVGTELGVRVATSSDEILHNDDIDAVAICSSTDTHIDLLVAASEAGKAVFCEKPLSLNLAEVDRGLAAADDAGIPLQIGFNRRFDASHKAVAHAVANGDIGEVHLVRITSRDPAPPPIEYIRVSGGIFMDMTIHDFDMARFVTRSEVVEVYAKGDVRVDPAIGQAGDLDTAIVVLTHDNGAITTIDNSRQAVYGYDQRVEAFGSSGLASSDNPLIHTTTVRNAEGAAQTTLPYFFLERYIPSYVAQWRAFCSSVTESRPTPVDGRDGRAPLVIGLAAWRSIQERRPVATAEIG